jgi:hypothetical protein
MELSEAIKNVELAFNSYSKVIFYGDESGCVTDDNPYDGEITSIFDFETLDEFTKEVERKIENK